MDIIEPYQRPSRKSPKKLVITSAAIALVATVGVVVYLFFWPEDLTGRIVIPYIAHQKPVVDPHLPSSNALADKLDEVEFDGLFNIAAGPSGVTYENGLGELVGIDDHNIVTVHLKSGVLWHDSYAVTQDGKNVSSKQTSDHAFTAADLAFTLQRIQRLGSLSPDYILVSQALDPLGFEGPDENNNVRFRFKGGRIWTDSDMKEVLSFKILPATANIDGTNFEVGTGPYMSVPDFEGIIRFRATDQKRAQVGKIDLLPFVDNSTYTTEFASGAINVLLEPPFGSISPVIAVPKEGFVKSNISTTFFAILFNVQRLNRQQRQQLRQLFNNKIILDRFFKTNTQQQREIVDYKGNRDNFDDYLNSSVFPSSTYYVKEKVIEPSTVETVRDIGILPDTVRIEACVNEGFREEYTELIDILNDPSVTMGRVRAVAVPNEELRKGNYDAVLVAFPGYRSNFLFDLYDVFLREPDLETYRIHLETEDEAGGHTAVAPASFSADRNFFRLDASSPVEQADVRTLLEDIYSFMSTRQIGDKQEYARRVDALEHEMALGAWLFSIPSLAYFSNQFDDSSIDLYGVASQLSTIEKWKERPGR